MNKCGNKEVCCSAKKKENSNDPTELEEDNVSSLTKQIVFGPAFDSAKKWYLIVLGSTFAHKKQCEICERRGRFLNVTQVILNAIVSSAIFTSMGDTTNEIDEDKKYALQVGAGTLSVLSAILSAVSRTLDYEGRREAHFNAKRAFAKIKRKMEMLLFIKQTPLVVPSNKDKQQRRGVSQWKDGPKMLFDMEPAWEDIVKEWEQVEADYPDVPRKEKLKYSTDDKDLLNALKKLDPNAFAPILENRKVDDGTGISEGISGGISEGISGGISEGV